MMLNIYKYIIILILFTCTHQRVYIHILIKSYVGFTFYLNGLNYNSKKEINKK